MSTLTLARPHLVAENAISIPLPLLEPDRQRSPDVDSTPAAEGGIHPGAIALALGGYGIFLAASWAGWAFGYNALLIAVIYFLSAMYFGLLIGPGMLSARSRGDRCQRSFRAFLNGRVQTLTGPVSGLNALVQVAFMPILLGCTMTFFAIVWLVVR